MEKVHLQRETNKNLFKELEVSFIQGDISRRLSEDLGDMKIAVENTSPAKKVDKSVVISTLEQQVRQLEVEINDLMNGKDELKTERESLY